MGRLVRAFVHAICPRSCDIALEFSFFGIPVVLSWLRAYRSL